MEEKSKILKISPCLECLQVGTIYTNCYGLLKQLYGLYTICTDWQSSSQSIHGPLLTCISLIVRPVKVLRSVRFVQTVKGNFGLMAVR